MFPWSPCLQLCRLHPRKWSERPCRSGSSLAPVLPIAAVLVRRMLRRITPHVGADGYLGEDAQPREEGLTLLRRVQLGPGLPPESPSGLLRLLFLLFSLPSSIGLVHTGGSSGLRPSLTCPGMSHRRARVRRGAGGLADWPLRAAVVPANGGECRVKPLAP